MSDAKVPYTKANTGEGDEGAWSWLTPGKGVSRYVLVEPWHDEQYSSDPALWWGAASHRRPSSETWPDG